MIKISMVFTCVKHHHETHSHLNRHTVHGNQKSQGRPPGDGAGFSQPQGVNLPDFWLPSTGMKIHRNLRVPPQEIKAVIRPGLIKGNQWVVIVP